MKRKYTRIDKKITDEVIKHYAENKSIVKASAHFNIGLSTANRILKKNGIERDGRRLNSYGNLRPSANWKGGHIKTSDGYILVHDPLNIMSNTRGYVFQHRLVMARHIGRALLRTEVVHHIDDNKENNELSNLVLFKSQAEHIAHHRKTRKYHM